MKQHLFLTSLVLCGVMGLVYQMKSQTDPEPAPIAQAPVPPQPQPEPPAEPVPPPKIEPEWTQYAAQRQINDSNLGKVLADIESHMPAGHIYRDSDKITWGHETTHGINSHLRMKFPRPGKRINGFYCLENRAAIIEEPRTTMQAAAALVPASLKGGVYNLYMVQQARSWGDTPLYIFDEWVAYTNGSAVRKDLQIQARAETVQYMLEFNVYSIALAQAVKKNCPDYDDQQFKAFMIWSLERSFELYNNESGAAAYWEKVRSNGDAEGLRQFAREYFGSDWTKRVLGF